MTERRHKYESDLRSNKLYLSSSENNIYIYVCMYACMHVCMYVCMYIYMGFEPMTFAIPVRAMALFSPLLKIVFITAKVAFMFIF